MERLWWRNGVFTHTPSKVINILLAIQFDLGELKGASHVAHHVGEGFTLIRIRGLGKRTVLYGNALGRTSAQLINGAT